MGGMLLNSRRCCAAEDTHFITFEIFSNWWFSGSKIAKKLKQSVGSKHVVRFLDF